jgi:hypothetical protein
VGGAGTVRSAGAADDSCGRCRVAATTPCGTIGPTTEAALAAVSRTRALHTADAAPDSSRIRRAAWTSAEVFAAADSTARKRGEHERTGADVIDRQRRSGASAEANADSSVAAIGILVQIERACG